MGPEIVGTVISTVDLDTTTVGPVPREDLGSRPSLPTPFPEGEERRSRPVTTVPRVGWNPWKGWRRRVSRVRGLRGTSAG